MATTTNGASRTVVLGMRVRRDDLPRYRRIARAWGYPSVQDFIREVLVAASCVSEAERTIHVPPVTPHPDRRPAIRPVVMP